MVEFKINPEMGGTPDEAIIEVCKILTEKGYVTRASCEGHLGEALYDKDGNWVESYETGCVVDKCGYLYLDIALSAYILFEEPIYDYGFQYRLPKYWKIDTVSEDEPTPDKVKTIAVRNVNTEYPMCDEPFYVIRLRPATAVEILVSHSRRMHLDELPDFEKIQEKLIDFKDRYMKHLRTWAEDIPDRSMLAYINSCGQQ